MSNRTKQLQEEKLAYVDSAALFEKVADQPWAIFLDSGKASADEAIGTNNRYDVLAMKPNSTLVYDQQKTVFQNNGARDRLYGDPISILKATLGKIGVEEVDQAYMPGAYGYFSYDLARSFEKLPSKARDEEELPAMAMGIYYVIVLVDHEEKSTKIRWLGDDDATLSLVQEWRDLIDLHVEYGDSSGFETEDKSPSYVGRLLCADLFENMDREDYKAAFDSVREYTLSGDCYQVNLTKRFSAEANGDAWVTYRALRDSSPAPYGCYMNLPFAQILSNSPEQFISCRNRNVVTSPIKGTRPRALHSETVDKAVANSLENSAKDRAENVMIVDLMRNDLSKSCELGSVKVPELFGLHSFANVHHLVSTVVGKLRRDLHALDLFKKCFPGGSITGAPKIRAMEIIEELEPDRRGLYCGSIGYVGYDGSLESNIAIRTIVVKDGVARYGAGGGLVIDSELGAEYQEILDKASMMNLALTGQSSLKAQKA